MQKHCIRCGMPGHSSHECKLPVSQMGDLMPTPAPVAPVPKQVFIPPLKPRK